MGLMDDNNGDYIEKIFKLKEIKESHLKPGSIRSHYKLLPIILTWLKIEFKIQPRGCHGLVSEDR